MSELQQTTRERLLDVATELFSTKGFKGTSIRDIAREMGMCNANIYHHFGNKDGLLLAILNRSSATVATTLKRVQEKNDLVPLEKLKLLLRTHIYLCAAQWKASKVFFLDEKHLSEEGLTISRDGQRGIVIIYMNILEELKNVGMVNHLDLKVLAFNILGTINWQLRWFRPGGRLSVEEVADETISFIIHGISGTTAQTV